MKKFEPEAEPRVRPRLMETISVQIPADALASLNKVAENRDMSSEALIRLYIGQGLRQDLSRLFSEQILSVTAAILAQHGQSEEDVVTILQEIRAKVVS